MSPVKKKVVKKKVAKKKVAKKRVAKKAAPAKSVKAISAGYTKSQHQQFTPHLKGIKKNVCTNLLVLGISIRVKKANLLPT